MLKYIIKLLDILLISILLISCGAFITLDAKFIPNEDYKQELSKNKLNSKEIEIFLTSKEIKRKYKEIGVLESKQLGDGWSFEEKRQSAEEKIIKAVRKKALKIGVDAVIEIKKDYEIYIPTFRFSSVPYEDRPDPVVEDAKPKKDEYKQVKVHARYLAIIWIP